VAAIIREYSAPADKLGQGKAPFRAGLRVDAMLALARRTLHHQRDCHFPSGVEGPCPLAQGQEGWKAPFAPPGKVAHMGVTGKYDRPLLVRQPMPPPPIFQGRLIPA